MITGMLPPLKYCDTNISCSIPARSLNLHPCSYMRQSIPLFTHTCSLRERKWKVVTTCAFTINWSKFFLALHHRVQELERCSEKCFVRDSKSTDMQNLWHSKRKCEPTREHGHVSTEEDQSSMEHPCMTAANLFYPWVSCFYTCPVFQTALYLRGFLDRFYYTWPAFSDQFLHLSGFSDRHWPVQVFQTDIDTCPGFWTENNFENFNRKLQDMQ